MALKTYIDPSRPGFEKCNDSSLKSFNIEWDVCVGKDGWKLKISAEPSANVETAASADSEPSLDLCNELQGWVRICCQGCNNIAWNLCNEVSEA